MNAKLRKALVDTIREQAGCGMEEAQRILDSPPAYVRRLRDCYVGDAINGLCANMDGAKATAELGRGTDITETVGCTAVAFANAAIRALGYKLPGEEEDNA